MSGTPETCAIQYAAVPWLDPEILKISIVTTKQVTVATDIEEIRIVRATSCMVSLGFVSSLTAAVATPPPWNCPRKADARAIEWATRPIVPRATADTARAWSGFGG